jgi:hypothetical protein
MVTIRPGFHHHHSTTSTVKDKGLEIKVHPVYTFSERSNVGIPDRHVNSLSRHFEQ